MGIQHTMHNLQFSLLHFYLLYQEVHITTSTDIVMPCRISLFHLLHYNFSQSMTQNRFSVQLSTLSLHACTRFFLLSWGGSLKKRKKTQIVLVRIFLMVHSKLKNVLRTFLRTFPKTEHFQECS